MDKFAQKEMMKKRPVLKSTWHDCYDWLLNDISESIKKVGGIKDKIMSLFKTNTTKNYGGGKIPRKPKIKEKTIRRCKKSY